MTSWRNESLGIEQRVEALLAELTLEQKAAQLGSIWPVEDGVETVAGVPKPRDVAPEMQSMFGDVSGGGGRTVPETPGRGHLTRPFGRHPQTVTEGVRATAAFQRTIMDASGHGIPAIVHEESLTGFCTYGATVFPTPLAWGATFDPALVEEMATAIGEDLRAVGVHQALSPLLDVVRDYRWGRCEETCGEDPYLVGTLGTAYVRGLQGAGVYATLKHFVGYSASKAGRNHAPVEMGRRQLEDILLPPFEMAVREGGAESVMNSYSDIDGVPAGANRFLLTEVLRDRWGFTGTVVSDYFAVMFLWLHHRLAEDRRGAAALALAAGLDVELPFTAAFAALPDAVRTGDVPEELLDRAVRRVLTQKVRLGLLDAAYDPDAAGDETVNLDSPRNRDIARRMAEESLVLLANDGTLPLAPETRVALIGPTSDQPHSFMGCYAYPNHVLSAYSGDGIGLPVITLGDAFRAAFATVTQSQGVPVRDPDTSGIEAAVATVATTDVVVLAVGDVSGLFGEGTSGEGCDVGDLRLPGAQHELVEAVLATGKPVVLLLLAGRPYALGAYVDRCAAVVQAFFPGIEAAEAITGVLTGRVNPSGHLPVGVLRHPGGQPGTYLGSRLALEPGTTSVDPRPLYGFGHGLSYTSFEVSDLELSAGDIPVDGQVEVSVTVRNSGERDGATVVQLYASDAAAQVVRPVIELIGYAKVRLAAGQSHRVHFAVDADRFSFTGLELRRIVEPGVVSLSVGLSSTERPLVALLTLTGAVRDVGEGRVLTTPVRLS
jgi:beta-glucosidase